MKAADLCIISPFTMEQFAHYVNLISRYVPPENQIEASGDTQASKVCEIFERHEKNFKWTPLKVVIIRELTEAMMRGDSHAASTFVMLCSMLNQPEPAWPHIVVETHKNQVKFIGARMRTLRKPNREKHEEEVVVKIKNPRQTGRMYVRKHWLKYNLDPEFWRAFA